MIRITFQGLVHGPNVRSSAAPVTSHASVGERAAAARQDDASGLSLGATAAAGRAAALWRCARASPTRTVFQLWYIPTATADRRAGL